MLRALGSHLKMLPVPRTNAEWAQALRQCIAATETLNLNRSQYKWPWLVRTHRFVQRCATMGSCRCGSPRIRIQKELQREIKPNQNKRLGMRMSKLAKGSLRKLLRQTRCKEPVEIMSVYACAVIPSWPCPSRR